MSGWYIFSYLFGGFSCLLVLGWRSYKDPDEPNWDEDETEEYVNDV